MTDAEINCTIAEHCKLCTHPMDQRKWWYQEPAQAYHNGIRCRICHSDKFDPPNYVEDLNACHSAEQTLTRDQQAEYHNNLYELLPCDENHGSCFEDGEDIMTPSNFTVLHATARQRAVAFLRTIGKWVESTN